MAWLPLLGTLLGAVIALGSALIVERRRERKEERRERLKAKQEMYARYLGAHADTRTQLRIISLATNLTDEERGYRAYIAYAACYAPRYEIAVLAPPPVLALAKDFDRCARDLRDLIVEGTRIQTHGRQHMQRYLDALNIVQAAMRTDLGTDGND
ncbi:hypothetical protein ACFVZ3_09965 [Kitasatospora purpeofusca]|uniref:hypothetical protein n=1 Tax=Kitasatospora purpeofusca TaxID=67352 RepID=UPI003699A31A